jgi:tryptophan 2,3-dioxygenase
MHRGSPEAERLRQTLEEPIFNPLLKKWVGRGELDYELYLQTDVLLSLQSPAEERVVHDELLFQIVHQTQELWMKLVAAEAVELVAELDGGRLWPASARLDRMARVLRGMIAELGVLETMTPDTYQVLRRSLGNGSGQESPGYNAVRAAADVLGPALDRLVARRGLTLRAVYTGEAGPVDELKRICEQLLDVDEAFQNWLHAHMQLVRRTIGIARGVKALDGLPTQVLPARTMMPLFPALWDVRVQMTAGWSRDGGHAPGAPRARAVEEEREVPPESRRSVRPAPLAAGAR